MEHKTEGAKYIVKSIINNLIEIDADLPVRNKKVMLFDKKFIVYLTKPKSVLDILNITIKYNCKTIIKAEITWFGGVMLNTIAIKMLDFDEELYKYFEKMIIFEKI